MSKAHQTSTRNNTAQSRGSRKASKSGAPLDQLHALQQLASEEPSFARSLKHCGSTQAAAGLARERGIHVSAEALWRNRGRRSLPTWSG